MRAPGSFTELKRNKPLVSGIIAALLLSAFHLACFAAPPVRKGDGITRVFIFAGQSNMVGSDSDVQEIGKYPHFVGLDKPQSEVLYSYNLGREDKRTSNGWTALQPVDGVVVPELSFGRKVARETGNRVAIIKCAAGGTTLGYDWNPDDPSGFKLYPIALQLVKSSLAELDQKKIPYRLEGFMWHQGENDMFDRALKPAYAANLKNFMESWRRDLKAPGLKFYIGELCTKTIWGMDNRTNMLGVRTGQKAAVASDPLSEYIPTNHVAVKIGGDVGLHYHYGTLGQLEHGENYADAYLRTRGKKTATAHRLKKWPYAKGSVVKLYILAGHRNMEGERGFIQELANVPGGGVLTVEDPQIAYKFSIGGGYSASAGWQPLAPTGFYDTFGPEVSFGHALKQRAMGNIAIAKFTHSGSQINDWTPEGTEAKDLNLYPKFLAFIQSAMREIQAKGNRVELAGIVYHIGENDMSFYPYRTNAVRWLKSVIVKSREDLNAPNLKWYVSQQVPTDDKSVNGVDVTGNLEALAKADLNTLHVKVFDLAPYQDKLVFNTEGIVKLGEALATAVSGR